MRFVNFLILVALLTGAASTSFAQVELVNPRSYDLPFYFLDMVNFRGSDPEKSQLQIYVKVPYDELQFVRVRPDSFVAQYEISMIALDEDNFQTDTRVLQRQLVVTRFEDTNVRGVYDFVHTEFNLLPGRYKIIVGVMDKETNQTTTREVNLELRDFRTAALTISDVLIADSIHVNDEGLVTAFPHVNLPREQSTRVLGYFQVYTRKKKGKLNIEITVRNGKNKKVYQDDRDFPVKSDVTPIVFEIPDGELSHGKYALKIKAKMDGEKAEYETTFSIRSRGLPLTASDLEAAIKQLQYIASSKEIKNIEKAPEDSQKVAFIEFWKRRDPTPGTEENELMTEYYRRIEYANEHFGRFGEGWRSDMGMIYVILGEPNDVERNPFNSVYQTSFSSRPIKAFEVWHYYQYNRYFVFIDETGFGDFRLLNPVSLNDLLNIAR